MTVAASTLLIASGLLVLVSARWWMPRQMSAARRRAAQHGRQERFDEALRSRRYRYGLRAVEAAGVIASIWGVIAVIGTL
jgi:ABC-type nickel/cobalt efflux system permease component RcnA